MTNAAVLSGPERDKVLQLLRDSEADLLHLAAGVSDEQWAFKASPETWSIGEIVEHLARLEPLVARRLHGTMSSEAEPEWEGKIVDLVALQAGVLNRSSRIAAPEIAQPKSEAARDELMASYREAREKTIAYASEALPFKRHFAMHPVLGNLSVHGWLAAIALHNMRHNLQIAEVKTAPGYPA